MDGGEGFTFFDAVADALVKFETDGMIDGIFLFLAAAAENGQGNAELLAICSGDVSADEARNIALKAGFGQTVGFVNDARVSALQLDVLSELFACLAGSDHFFGEVTAFVNAFCSVAKEEHPPRKLEA